MCRDGFSVTLSGPFLYVLLAPVHYNMHATNDAWIVYRYETCCDCLVKLGGRVLYYERFALAHRC